MRGSGWCSQVLNTLERYKVLRDSSSLLLFSSVAGSGGEVGIGGGGDLLGHWHGRLGGVVEWMGDLSPVLVVMPESETLAMPVWEKDWLMIPRSVQASWLRKTLLTLWVTYTICLVVLPDMVSDSLRIVAPRISRLLLLAARMRRFTGMRSSVVKPWRMFVPARQL